MYYVSQKQIKEYIIQGRPKRILSTPNHLKGSAWKTNQSTAVVAGRTVVVGLFFLSDHFRYLGVDNIFFGTPLHHIINKCTLVLYILYVLIRIGTWQFSMLKLRHVAWQSRKNKMESDDPDEWEQT